MTKHYIQILNAIFSKQKIKLLFGLIFIFIGIALFLSGQLSYFFLIFIITGIYILILSFIRMRNLRFYLLTLIPAYYVVSMYYEGMKRYELEVTLPDHKKEYLFILSNTKLKWIDYPLTWFTSNTIKVDLTKRSVVYLNRGMPINMRENYKAIYMQGYSVSNVRNHKYDYIVFIPLLVDQNSTLKDDINKHFNLMRKNNELQDKIINKKIDSLEKL
jgi:hypothetical protein